MTTATLTETARAAALRPLFIATVALGSFLLFLIQPLVARLVLPVLGGSPSVWNTAMLFYQSALLVGYAYAHALQRLPFRTQAIIHLGLLGLAALTLPIGIAATGAEATGNAAAYWLIGLLAMSIGPVFVAVAAQAPLMQAWFARSTDPAAASPFFLYSASNLGSLLGLLAYPFLLEPFSALPFQQLFWSAGYVVLALLVAFGALSIWKGGDRPPATLPDTVSAHGARPVTAWRALHWLLLAAVPSGLLLSTTTHITTDIMAMPLLWVVPLAAYLVSFILVFSRHGPVHTRIASWLAPIALLVAGGFGLLSMGTAATVYGLASILLLLIVATSLHGALAADRPAAARLTLFYLVMAAGGVLGGLFPALIAPQIFDWVYEHPILLLAAGLLVPARPLTRRIGQFWTHYGIFSRALRILTPPITLALGWVLGFALNINEPEVWQIAAVAAIAGIAVLAIGRPLAFTWHLAMLMLALGGWQQIDISATEGARYRSFFGIYTIQNSQATATRRLLHGTTLHGAQSLSAADATQPMTYYAPETAAGLILSSLPITRPRAHVGLVGLGTGSLLCYSSSGQRWTVFEIDPLMVEIASNPEAFSYVSRCAPDARMVVGDARLMLAREPQGSFDVLLVDAFSSDAIPLHLMTKEAFASWFRALAPDGLLVLHISNRFLDLQPMVAALAKDMGLAARIVEYMPTQEELLAGKQYNAAQWVLIARDQPTLDAAIAGTVRPWDFLPLEEKPGLKGWTDSFASILPILKPFWRGFI